ncbi:PspC domain-containing protein [uncultured Methanobrevibacter sp.]|uniref:PspC domain-containing protein n=1 Tax=uncultured Methanobrevibacter sp. TaxID=253161 RepID=UPI0025EA730C|nr:PspC domain-containing protein [uncultured Methanobrevibacter sp.]
MTGKKLYRSYDNRMLAGICGGIGEYLNIDPTIIRLITALLIFLWGFGIIFYLLAWIIVPNEIDIV